MRGATLNQGQKVTYSFLILPASAGLKGLGKRHNSGGRPSGCLNKGSMKKSSSIRELKLIGVNTGLLFKKSVSFSVYLLYLIDQTPFFLAQPDSILNLFQQLSKWLCKMDTCQDVANEI